MYYLHAYNYTIGFSRMEGSGKLKGPVAQRGSARGLSPARKGLFYNPPGKAARGGVFAVLV